MDPVWEGFERGEITGCEYHRHLCASLGIDLSYDQFVAGWNSIYGDVFEVARGCLQHLEGKLKLVVLTNTNAVHCEAWTRKYEELLRSFDEIFISSEIGQRKPERGIYEYVLGKTGVEAVSSLFFDDVPDNVAAATGLGISGVLVDRPERIREALERYNLM